MDPVSLVLAALAAGASTALSATANTAIVDAYNALKTILRRRLSESGRDPTVLDEPPPPSEPPHAGLAGKLTVDDLDDQIVAAARELLKKADPVGARTGKYAVRVENSKGVVIGDGSTVNQVIS